MSLVSSAFILLNWVDFSEELMRKIVSIFAFIFAISFFCPAHMAAQSSATDWMQLAKLTASDGQPNDDLGISVAMSGNTVVAGVSRAVYLFEKPATGWQNMTQLAELTPSEQVNGFGYSVAIDGDIVVVGVPGYDSDNGAVYVYVKPRNGWTNMTETAILTAGAENHYYPIGYSVAIGNDTVLADSYEGTTLVYVKPPSGWQVGPTTPKASLTMPYGTESLAISEQDTVVLGALDETYLEGSAFVFLKPKGGWSGKVPPVAQLVPSDPTFFFGRAVGIDKEGDTVVAGAYNGCEFCDLGALYVFVEPAHGWADMRQTAKLKNHNKLTSGLSAAIGGKTILAGAPYANVGINQFQGAVYGFSETKGVWKTSRKSSFELTASDGAIGDELGTAIAAINGTIVAGAPYANIGSNAGQGAVYVFGK